MNYSKIYDTLISRGQSRESHIGYYEKHHIIPKCIGGSNESTNLVKLTPEEHYLAHQLLMRMNPSHHGLTMAALKMCQGRPSNKLYGWIRRRFSLMQSIKQSANNTNQDKRWIANEFETKLLHKDAAALFIESGTYIAGKKAKRAPCGHLVRDRCLSCEDAKAKSYIRKKENAAILANSLFLEFKTSGCTSVGEFAKIKNTSQPRLSLLWKRYVLEYRENRQPGKRFFR